MHSRHETISAFLDSHGWSDADISPLAGDASNRRYLRLKQGDARAVLMDAPADKGEDIRPFIHVAQYLGGLGLSAPKILAANPETGLLALEDLGDDLFARVLERTPKLETELYQHATDLLATAHNAKPMPGLETYGPDLMVDMASLAFEFYARFAGAGQSETNIQAFRQELGHLLEEHATPLDVVIQRDYHAENLLWLPDRDGVARVGLLDFQDAMIGHRAYDLVSLLQDARRDVSPDTEADMVARYCAATGQDRLAFTNAYAVLGAQRNLRIIGVFTRLCVRDGKAHYIDLIPRVWALLKRDLTHPLLAKLNAILHERLPVPSPEILAKLKDQCATRPKP